MKRTKRIVISSTGTHGDHLPYIALGKALKQQGYQVVMAFRASMASYVSKAGLEHAICGEDLTPEAAQARAQDWDEWQDNHQDFRENIGAMKDFFLQQFPVIFYQLEAACQGADLLICGLQRHLFGALLEKKYGLPWIAASVTPAFHCSGQAYQHQNQQKTIIGLFLPILENLAQQLHIPRGMDWFQYHENPRAILGSSRHFSTPTPPHAHYHQTGFWFYEDPTWSDWQPDDDLKRFVERSPAPLFLSFSSIPVSDPQRVLQTHVQAAKRLGRGLVVQRGWANFNESLLASEGDRPWVHFVDFMPQGWLLERTAAIIHHGGIGTLGRALRHHCPMVVEPLGNDQFFNAQRVIALEIGIAVHPHKVTPEGLAHLLEEKILTEARKQRVIALGEKIAQEAGLHQALMAIQRYI